MLEYKGYLFGDGAHIVGTIQGKPVEGKLHIEGTNYYFCQNEMLGTAGDNLHGYEYSWIFRKKGDTLTDGVEIFTEEQPEKPKIEFNKNVFDSRFVKTRILSGDISFSYYNKFDLKFNMHKIPNDASMIISNINLFNDLDDLSDEVKNSVLNLLKKSLKLLQITNKRLR
ncbi:MAG: hypothetical protein ACOC1K_05550, partial [Nanoarchaeota archaeon]